MDQVQVPTAAGTFDTLCDGPAGGRAVLLLHGFPQDARSWEHQLASLGAAGHRVVAVDQRGYSPGVRPVEVEAYRLDHMVGDALAVADALGWDRFDLAGHDWGAAVAWALAAGHADRVRTLAAVSTPHPAALATALRESPEQRAQFAYQAFFRQEGTAEEALLADGAARLQALFDGRVPPGRVQRYVARFAEPGALTAALNWYRAPRAPATAAVTVPTLYVWSTGDLAFGGLAAETTAEWVRGPYRFEVLDGVSHWIPEEAPERLGALLLEHLAAHC